MRWLQKSEALIGVDVGSTGVKVVAIDIRQSEPQLLGFGYSPLGGEVFSQQRLTGSEMLSRSLSEALLQSGITDRRVVTAMPAPSVFVKHIQLPKMSLRELQSNISFEIANYIPQNIGNVKVDFHIAGEANKSQLDVLVVAVKNDVVESFLSVLSQSGVETAIVDVDYFALQNIFETNYPEEVEKTVALLNIGARYTAMNVCRGGESLLTGDVAIGGKMFTDALADAFSVSVPDAEKFKRAGGKGGEGALAMGGEELLKNSVESAASELNRQLSFLWNASGSDEGIDGIYLTGGGALTSGLVAALESKTGIPCVLMETFRGVQVGAAGDAATDETVAPMLGIAAGLALRELGDKVIPEYEE